jgi:hypothetical protein
MRQALAEVLGCPVGTVMSRLHREPKLLERELRGCAKRRGIVQRWQPPGERAATAGRLAGTLAEPALLKKFFNAGVTEIQVPERRVFGLDDLTRYPIFAPDFTDFLRRIMPPCRHRELVFSIVVTARKADFSPDPDAHRV